MERGLHSSLQHTWRANIHHLHGSSASESYSSTSGFCPFFRLTQPWSGPSPLIFWYCSRLFLRNSCSILAPVTSLSGTSGDCMLSPFRTRIPPAWPPPTTSHMRPVSGPSCTGKAYLLASSFAAARRFAASSWTEACRTDSSRSVVLEWLASSCLAAFIQGGWGSSRSLGPSSESPASTTTVMMERSGELTLAAPAPATLSQKLKSLSLWFKTTTTRVSVPAPRLVKAVTSSASRLVPQTTRRAPGRMNRAKWAKYQKAGW
mmetsp:Transcript_56862/g.176376  ORF Transcript_56862/g.176376 Transcript_56862/m.176376 type:complete len:261 (+) Transcript_56862:227-1009(+)